jgi:choline dehydrogenase
MAVMDQHGRVHGLERLRLVGAEVMPDVIRADPNTKAITVAERAADWIKEGK